MATIYIVEDDVNIREIERYALKNSGYEVEEFESGESLFKRLERAVPSLLLLDIMLPEEDGLQILRKIQPFRSLWLTQRPVSWTRSRDWISERMTISRSRLA